MFIFNRSHQVDEDIQKLKTVYSLLEAHPGPDKFELCIPKNGEGVVIGYDLGIKYDSELAQKLHQLGVTVQA